MKEGINMHNLNTTNWNTFPFEVNGINFVSKVSNDSPFMARIKMLPAGAFEQMNKGAIIELVGLTSTLDELQNKLDEVNAGATHAVIELA